MSESDERYELVSEPEDDANPPTWWIQDVTTVADEAPGKYLGKVEVRLPTASWRYMATTWTTDVLTTEAVVVLTIARQDAATIVARVLAALNGEEATNDHD